MTGTRVSLEAALASADFIPQLFGVCPYSKGKDSHRFSLGWLRVCYTLFLALFISGYLLYWFYVNFENSKLNQLEKIQMLLLGANCGSSVATAMLSLSVVGDLNLALDSLRASGVAGSEYSSRFRLNVLWSLLFPSIWFFALFAFGVYIAVWCYGGHYIASIINIAFINQFVAHLSILKDAFQKIREWIIHPNEPKFEAAISSFERISVAAEHYNTAFGTQILLLMGANFIIITTNVYSIISEKMVWYNVIYVLWALATATCTIRIVYAVDVLLKQRNDFNNTIITLLVEGREFSDAEVAKVKLHISMNKELKFTARGFFLLDYGQITSMVGAIVTYLVILMEFDQ